MTAAAAPAAAAYPWLFVALWSTGFVGAKLGLPHAAPLSFLFVRYLLVIALMGLVAFATRAPWPRDPRQWLHIGIAGLLVHAIYLGGVFVAISLHLPAGVASLVVGLQPLLAAFGAALWLDERVGPKQWTGLLLGLAGTALVVGGKLGSDFGWDALAAAVVALCGITVGTLYQKRFCRAFDWRSGAVLQFAPTAVVTGLVVFAGEGVVIDWTGEFLFALGWLVVVLSLGAVSLLNHLIRSGTAVNVASLFYLVPPCTALMAWAAFDETLSGGALAGMALAIWGVYWARS